MKIEPVASTVGDILKTSFYKIPRFQRPYSWQKEHIEDFWHDTVESEDQEYFIGSMVFYKSERGVVSVVDGQQRITTITLILCAIRNAFKEYKLTELANGIHQLIQRKDIDNKLRSVLKTETSYPYLQEHILKASAAEMEAEAGEEETGLKDAFRYIGVKFDEQIGQIAGRTSLSKKDRSALIKKRLTEIRDKILDLKTISITLDNEDDAYLIFETLNTRGQDLETAHLVKSHITRLVQPSTGDTDPAKERWNALVRGFDRRQSDASINSYLHHSWLAQHEYTTEKKLFKAIRTEIHTRAQAKAYLDSLVGDAETYQRIFNSADFKWKKEESKVRGSLLALGVFHVRQAAPFVFALLREYYSGHLKLRRLKRALRQIECFHFISTAISSRHSSGGISMMYASAARRLSAITGHQTRDNHLRDFRTKLAEKLPPFDVFSADFRELSYLERLTKQKPLVRYILMEADNYLRSDKVADYDLMTIEHIAPQNPRGTSTLPEDYVGNIGNLILVSEELNSKLDGKPFIQKKKILRDAGVPLGKTLKDASKWSAAEIETRAHELATLGYEKIWKF